MSDGTDAREKILRHNIRGVAFLNQQNWASGQEEFELALALTDSEPILLNNLAVALLQQSSLEEAEVHLRKAEALDDREPHILYNLGLIHKGRGEFESSAGYLRRVVEIDEGDIPALYSLGSVLARLGNPEDIADARSMFEAALNRNPTHVSSLYSLGRLLIQEGDREAGTALIEKSQEIRTRDGIDVAMGTQYGEQGTYAMAAPLPGPGLVAPEVSLKSYHANELRLRRQHSMAEAPGHLPKQLRPPLPSRHERLHVVLSSASPGLSPPPPQSCVGSSKLRCVCILPVSVTETNHE